MVWVVWGIFAAALAVVLSSLSWARRPERTGVVLLGLCIVSMFGIGKEAVWGVTEAEGSPDGWCLTYEHPDGSSFIECRPTEDEAWAWADALDAELEEAHGPRERETASGVAFGVLFYVSLAGAVGSFGWAYAARRRANRR